MEQVIELRRYLIKDGARVRFARYFESWFPEAFQQIGAHALGQFLAVDVIRERPRGAVVAWLFPVQAGRVDAFAAEAEATFAAARAAGVREAGLLVTLDVPNNFPRHPIRSDGPWLVWLGIVEDDRMLARLPPLPASGLLRGAPERVVLDPTDRSRLRWTD